MNRSRISMLALALTASLSLSIVPPTAAQEEPIVQAPPVQGEPFAGVFSGSISFQPLESATEACPFGVRTITDATGSTTLGEVTLHAEHCSTPGLPTVPTGEQSLTTQSGDQINGVYFVDCDPVLPTAEAGEPIDSVGRFRITGGTGAYAEAAGSASEVAFVWFPGSLEIQDWPWVAQIEGIISH